MSDREKKQSIVAPAAVIAAGLASATAAVVTSTFGVAGTIIGAALTAMIINGGSAIYRVYIESASSRIRELPGTVGIRSADRWNADLTSEAHPPPEQPEPQRNFLSRFRAALSWFPSLPRFRRRSILIGALAAGVASFLLSMGAVTGLELGVGKSLSCWVWDECPTGSSADGDRASRSTRPSIFGGQSTSSSTTPKVEPSDPKQQPVPDTPESPSQVPGSEETPDPQAPGQRWSPSGAPKDQEREEDQKQVPPGDSKDKGSAPSE